MFPDQLTQGIITPRAKRPMPPPVGGGFAPPDAPPIAPRQPDPMEQAALRLQEQAKAAREIADRKPDPAKGLRAGLGTAATILGSLVNPQIGQILNQKLLHPGREKWQQEMDRAEEVQKINEGELRGLEGIARVQDLRQNRMDVNADRDAARTDAQRSSAIAEEGRLRGQGAEDAPPDIAGAFRRGLIDPANPSGILPQKVTRYAPGVSTEQQVSPDVGTVKTVEGGGYSNKLVLPTAGEKQRRKVEGIKQEEDAKREIAQKDWHSVTPEEATRFGKFGITAGQRLAPAEMRALVKDAEGEGWQYKSETDDKGNVNEWWVNPRTKESTAPTSKGKVGKSKSEPMSIGGMSNAQFTQAQNRAKEFDNEQTVKDFKTQANKLATMRALIDGKMGGPADLAVVYEFMKALDPNSVVRETEYDTAAKSGNIFKGALARFNGYLSPNGGFLPPEVKKDFTSIIEQKMGATRDQVATIYKDYERRIDELTGQPGTGARYMSDYAKLLAPKPQGGGTQSPLPKGDGKPLDRATAQKFYEAAGGDPAKARELAAQNGWK